MGLHDAITGLDIARSLTEATLRGCWIRADPRLSGTRSTCGNCPVVDDHPDLRGHEPDPARGYGALRAPEAGHVAAGPSSLLAGAEASIGPSMCQREGAMPVFAPAAAVGDACREGYSLNVYTQYLLVVYAL